jgi:hypothetical protein
MLAELETCTSATRECSSANRIFQHDLAEFVTAPSPREWSFSEIVRSLREAVSVGSLDGVGVVVGGGDQFSRFGLLCFVRLNI